MNLEEARGLPPNFSLVPRETTLRAMATPSAPTDLPPDSDEGTVTTFDNAAYSAGDDVNVDDLNLNGLEVSNDPDLLRQVSWAASSSSRDFAEGSEESVAGGGWRGGGECRRPRPDAPATPPRLGRPRRLPPFENANFVAEHPDPDLRAPLSPSLLLSSRKQAWIDESLSPEILGYRDDLVDRIRTLIARQEKIVEDYEQDHDKALTRMIRFAEVNRIKFTLRSYLRKRLGKIEAFAIHTYLTDDLSSRLSPQELEFAKDYIDGVNRVFQETVLNFLPRDYDSLIHQSEAMASAAPDMIPSPDLDKHVFVRVRDDLGDILMDETTTFRLQEGDIFAIRYGLIRDFVDSGRVSLL